MEQNLNITTYTTSRLGGIGELKISVQKSLSWAFSDIFYVKNIEETHEFLDSDEFKTFAYELFKKYEDLDYNEMCKLRNEESESERKAIVTKLDKYIWRGVLGRDDIYLKINKHKNLTNKYGVFIPYMLVEGEIINADMSMCKRFRTIVKWSKDDVLNNSYYDKYDSYDEKKYSAFKEKFKLSDKQKSKYADKIVYAMTDSIKSFSDCNEFFNLCNESIKQFNEKICC